jgi:2-keto-4-pentenoate hydratase/2-oxohepta-3-ene-1,7-dioic acid hydratase in catechol pathway
MKLIRYGTLGSEKPAVLATDEHGVENAHDLTAITNDVTGDFLANGGITTVRQALQEGSLPVIDLSGQRLGAPISRPSAIICIGMNYAEHAAESGSAPPTVPIIFLKTPNTVAGPNDATRIPRHSSKTDWEVELGVVIGRRASYLDTVEQSADHIAGYVAANDLSERTFQLENSGGQWSKGKCSPGFSPLGPWLVPAEDVDASGLRLRSWVNGQARQDSNTSDMIFPVDYLIYHLSQYLTLEPGDVVLTGTPRGVALSGKYPYLSAGDVVEIEIEGLGRQRLTFAPA